jgi:hypothetical protein
MEPGVISDIWRSFRRLPRWVQIWVGLWLVPVNIAPILFFGGPYALWVCCLSIGGMLPNLGIMIAERGLSKRMSLPHLIIWSPLVILVVWVLATQAPQGGYRMILWAVLITDIVSLGFDIPDWMKWRRGDRDIV